MKKVILLAILVLSSMSIYAQDDNNGTPLWTPPKAACDAYNAEKSASDNMTPAVKSLYEASQDKEETRASDILMPVICNPPTIKSNDENQDPDK